MECGDSRSAADDGCMDLTPGGRRLIRRLQNSYGTPPAANAGGLTGVANPSIKLTHYQLLKKRPGAGESEVQETKVYLLDCGTMSLDQSYMFLDAGLTGQRRFPVYGVLIDHAEGKFIFDTGFDAGHIRNVASFTEPMQSAEQTIPGQLDLIGVRPSQITHVVNSHYHIDHCGGNKYCTHATTICHPREL